MQVDEKEPNGKCLHTGLAAFSGRCTLIFTRNPFRLFSSANQNKQVSNSQIAKKHLVNLKVEVPSPENQEKSDSLFCTIFFLGQSMHVTDSFFEDSWIPTTKSNRFEFAGTLTESVYVENPAQEVPSHETEKSGNLDLGSANVFVNNHPLQKSNMNSTLNDLFFTLDGKYVTLKKEKAAVLSEVDIDSDFSRIFEELMKQIGDSGKRAMVFTRMIQYALLNRIRVNPQIFLNKRDQNSEISQLQADLIILLSEILEEMLNQEDQTEIFKKCSDLDKKGFQKNLFAALETRKSKKCESDKLLKSLNMFKIFEKIGKKVILSSELEILRTQVDSNKTHKNLFFLGSAIQTINEQFKRLGFLSDLNQSVLRFSQKLGDGDCPFGRNIFSFEKKKKLSKIEKKVFKRLCNFKKDMKEYYNSLRFTLNGIMAVQLAFLRIIKSLETHFDDYNKQLDKIEHTDEPKEIFNAFINLFFSNVRIQLKKEYVDTLSKKNYKNSANLFSLFLLQYIDKDSSEIGKMESSPIIFPGKNLVQTNEFFTNLLLMLKDFFVENQKTPFSTFLFKEIDKLQDKNFEGSKVSKGDLKIQKNIREIWVSNLSLSKIKKMFSNFLKLLKTPEKTLLEPNKVFEILANTYSQESMYLVMESVLEKFDPSLLKDFWHDFLLDFGNRQTEAFLASSLLQFRVSFLFPLKSFWALDLSKKEITFSYFFVSEYAFFVFLLRQTTIPSSSFEKPTIEASLFTSLIKKYETFLPDKNKLQHLHLKAFEEKAYPFTFDCIYFEFNFLRMLSKVYIPILKKNIELPNSIGLFEDIQDLVVQFVVNSDKKFEILRNIFVLKTQIKTKFITDSIFRILTHLVDSSKSEQIKEMVELPLSIFPRAKSTF